jgi:beta-lactamase class D
MRRIQRSLLISLIISSLIALVMNGFQDISISAQSDGITASQSEGSSITVAQAVDLSRPFQELGIEGSILIYDRNQNQFYEHNRERNSVAFSPASTFKIFNALVSLETGVIQNDVAVLTWDGIERQLPSWNRDTNLRQAFKDSTVWFFQILARKVGYERMQNWIEQVGYGNRQIGTPDQIDRFWLAQPLQITAKQQVEFLQRLARGDLPFSQRTMDLVKDIMIIERTPNYTFRGKTGLIASTPLNNGWFVGYLEQNNNAYFFATNIVVPTGDELPKRIEVTRRCLKTLGLL